MLQSGIVPRVLFEFAQIFQMLFQLISFRAFVEPGKILNLVVKIENHRICKASDIVKTLFLREICVRFERGEIARKSPKFRRAKSAKSSACGETRQNDGV